MKTIVKILVLITAIFVGYGCEPPSGGVPGIETVSGTIRNEDGEVLAGIQVDVYYDEELKRHYYAEEWEWWNSATDEERMEYADLNPIHYTNVNGYYEFWKNPQYTEEPTDIYVVATDTTGIYETQVKKGQIIYWSVTWKNGRTDTSGSGDVNFVLKKKQ